MLDEDKSTSVFESVKKAFIESFNGSRNIMEGNPTLVRCCADNLRVNEQVYYQIEYYPNDCWMLTFVIDTYANQREKLKQEVAKILENRIVHRFFWNRTYYSAFIIGGRNPITCVDDLKHDLDVIQNKIANIIKSNCVIINSVGNFEQHQNQEGKVTITAKDIDSLLSDSHFRIPDYQRGYCWKHDNIIGFLEDIKKWQIQHKEGCYQVGTMVLSKKRDQNQIVYDVIDGQQRLLTLAILAKCQGNELINIGVGANNKRQTSVWHLLRAQQVIKDWLQQKRPIAVINNENILIDISRIQVSIVCIDEQSTQGTDLPYLFFNHLNSLGKRLSDYDLLKSHHLRFIEGDGLSAIMAKRWYSIDKSTNEKLKDIDLKSEVLHHMMFRLRNWRNKSVFSYEADNSISRELFRHFSMDFTPVLNLCTSYKELRFDSILSGGLEFFNYVDIYRRKYEAFCETRVCSLLKNHLSWHSNGVLYDGIRALAFMFFCKFGDIYLNDATYCIAYRVSILRNEPQVRRSYLQGSEFQTIVQLIDCVTHESEFLGKMLDAKNRYSIYNKGGTAMNYWLSLKHFGNELEKIMSVKFNGMPISEL